MFNSKTYYNADGNSLTCNWDDQIVQELWEMHGLDTEKIIDNMMQMEMDYVSAEKD